MLFVLVNLICVYLITWTQILTFLTDDYRSNLSLATSAFLSVICSKFEHKKIEKYFKQVKPARFVFFNFYTEQIESTF